ncbi:MAG: NUDIX hydrolase [Clostridia bacterium]|nr:NUDIX hydrolase [Clostridia bacterium]
MKYIGEKIDNKEYKERKTSYGLIFNEKGEIAVAYIRKHDMYNLIGGKIEEKETSKEALIRETKEEIGYSLRDIEYVDNLGCYFYLDVMDKYELAIMDFYKAKLDKKICDPIEEDHELVWVKPEEIADKMYFEYHRYILNKYIKRNF